MRRRQFITFIGGAAAALPFAARAQQKTNFPTIGFISVSTPTAWSISSPRLNSVLPNSTGSTAAPWRSRLSLGRGTQRAVCRDIRGVRPDLKVDVILTGGSAVLAAKQATQTIPIVFALANDRSAPGWSQACRDRAGMSPVYRCKAPISVVSGLGLMREALPGLRRLAILANPASPQAAAELQEVKAEAVGLGFDPVGLEIRRAEDFAPAIDALKGRADALYACADALISANAAHINALRWRRACRRCSMRESISKVVASCPMGRMSPACFGAQQI